MGLDQLVKTANLGEKRAEILKNPQFCIQNCLLLSPYDHFCHSNNAKIRVLKADKHAKLKFSGLKRAI